MCGRFALATPPESLRKLLNFTNQPNFPSRFNIAPTQPVQIIRKPSGSRELATVRWGLVPGWMKPEKVAESQQRPQHNARGETVTEKPFFRQAFASRRCLIPADVFYEWNPKSKQPFCVRRRDETPFMMAGLWEFWEGADGSEIESCAVITTQANETLSHVHHRMPVMLDQPVWEDWLTIGERHAGKLVSLLRSAPEGDFYAYPISKDVNKVSNDTSALWQETELQSSVEKPQLDLF